MLFNYYKVNKNIRFEVFRTGTRFFIIITNHVHFPVPYNGQSFSICTINSTIRRYPLLDACEDFRLVHRGY